MFGKHIVCLCHNAMNYVSTGVSLHGYHKAFTEAEAAQPLGVITPVKASRFWLHGTPILVFINRAGDLLLNAFSHLGQVMLGAELPARMRYSRKVIVAEGYLPVKFAKSREGISESVRCREPTPVNRRAKVSSNGRDRSPNPYLF